MIRWPGRSRRLVPSESTSPTAASSPNDRAKGTFSCVVDVHPRFHLDALRWFAALTAVAGVEPTDLVAYVVGSAASDALEYLRAQGVRVQSVEPFDPVSPHCNKISGAVRLAQDGVDGLAVLCDTDVIVLEDPRTLVLPPRSIALKTVDRPNPPLEVLVDVFEASGLPLPLLVSLPWEPEQLTVSGNGNGGLYLIPGPTLSTVASAWEKWARWLIDRRHLLGRWTVHLDQVAMALALASEGIEPVSLDVRWNMPTHDVARIPPDAPRPAGIHYHTQVDTTGRIRLTGTASIDERISVANEAIGDLWHRAFPNATFWQWRYLTDPDLGSGVGSRGHPLEDKRRLLATLVQALQPTSVLDVGCGDGEATRGLSLGHYTGIDVSAEAVRRARISRPEGVFLVGTLADHRVEADVTLNLDVLIHEADPAAYQQEVAQLWRSAKRALVISGYERPFETPSPMIHFHEPLSMTMRRFAVEAEVYPVRHEHEITTLVALRPPGVRHPRDYDAATLGPLAARHPHPVSLIAMRVHAWRTLGFYPDHAPRLWEYPVVLHVLEDQLKPGSRIVDVGAGVSPLAPFLTTRGYVVDTVDPSSVRRIWPPTPDWNEWEFLDYAEAGLAHRSWNCALDQVPSSVSFDGAYSVSVIEHLPAAVRRALIGEISSRVRPGGTVVLTVDLVRDRDDLWNRSRGVAVEEESRHGTLQDVVLEAAQVGLEVFRCETVRNWGDTPVDIGLVAMRKDR